MEATKPRVGSAAVNARLMVRQRCVGVMELLDELTQECQCPIAQTLADLASERLDSIVAFIDGFNAADCASDSPTVNYLNPAIFSPSSDPHRLLS